MIYTKENNRIIVNDLSDFNIEHILECGQVFTYYKENNEYVVLSADKCARIKPMQDCCIIETEHVDYFVNYFDLNTDYGAIKAKLAQIDFMHEAIRFGSGIRILKQDLIETFVGFIISANNHIKRIKYTMKMIREQFGQNMGTYQAFPSIEKLLTITKEQFSELGAGYRSAYLVSAIKSLSEIDLNATKNLDTEQLKKLLLQIMGIGPKVADCILLFGYSRFNVFPIDTWTSKVYKDVFNNDNSRIKMREELVLMFNDLSGYAQQYLFYNKRNNKA